MLFKLFSPLFTFLTWQLENFRLHVRFIFVAHITFLQDGAVLSLSVEGGESKLLSMSRFQ